MDGGGRWNLGQIQADLAWHKQSSHSTANQMARIEAYAAAKGLHTVKAYLGKGRSGESFRGRPGLQN